ncbi:MAG: response regulator, partial [Gammaproteobacteria bacterium]|nr:response regulator [Gammaproteobacteria bacterium]
MVTAKKIRVLIVDDSDVAREILRTLLEDQQDIEVVAEARNGREAIELVQQLRPDLVTMDLNMPGISGIEAIERIMHDKA